MIILRIMFFAAAIFFLALTVSLGNVDGFLGIDYRELTEQQLTLFKQSFYVLFIAFMMLFAFAGGDE